MFCPICKTEYPEGFVTCADCGVSLVASVAEEIVEDDPPEVVWRGGDPVAFSRVIGLLREAGILHHVLATSDHLVFELGMPRPFYKVMVLRSDLASARTLVGPISDSLPFALSKNPEAFADEPHDQAGTPMETPGAACRDLSEQEATLEIWAGDDADFVGGLRNSLLANDIVCRTVSEPTGRLHVFVGPRDESRAREIIREIVEGVPPG